MEHEHFSITVDSTQQQISGGKLSTRLINWKATADQFYRGSEITFTQIMKDNQISMLNHALYQQTKIFNPEYVPDLDPVYFLQIGICLENMIKGLVTHINPSLVEGATIPNAIKSHNLKNLAAAIPSYQITDDEMKLLEFLTTHIVWFSRYPIPAKAKDAVRSAFYKTDEVRNLFLSIYNKLSRMMEATGELKAHLHNYEFSS